MVPLNDLPSTVSFDRLPKPSSLNSPADELALRSQISFLSGVDANLNLVVKCKDLLEYTIDLSSAFQEKGDPCLSKAPQPLAGGASIPVSIFNQPNGTQREQATIRRYEKIQSRVTQLVKQHSLAAPTYKLTHYEHMKAFIKKHEKIGNMVKFARDHNQYAIGYQHCEYNGRKPHFFIYDVQKRAVVRRLLPLSAPFSITEFLDEHDDLLQAQSIHNKGQEDNESLNQSMAVKQEEPVSEVTYFEVSPGGSFMLSIVENELLCFKLLNPGIVDFFKESLQPGYFSEEHQQSVSLVNLEGDKWANHSSSNVEAKVDISEFVKLDPSRSLADQLILSHIAFEQYVGSTFNKHVKFLQLYHMITKSLEFPESLINPGAADFLPPDDKTPVFADSNATNNTPSKVIATEHSELKPIRDELEKQVRIKEN